MNMIYDMMFELLSSNEIYFGKIMFMIFCAYLVVIHTMCLRANDIYICLRAGDVGPTGGRFIYAFGQGNVVPWEKRFIYDLRVGDVVPMGRKM